MTQAPRSHVPVIDAMPRERARKTAEDLCREGCPLPYPLLERTLCYHCCQWRTGDEQVMLLPPPDPSKLKTPLAIGTSVTELIAALASRGITIRLKTDNCTLLARPREALTPDVAAAIKAHKIMLIRRFKAAQPAPPEAWHDGLAQTLTEDFDAAVLAWRTRDIEECERAETLYRPELLAAHAAKDMKALRNVVDAMDAAYMVFWEDYLPQVDTNTAAQIWARTPEASGQLVERAPS